MKRIICETQPMLDLRHLAHEIYPLLRGQAQAHQAQANQRLAIELAETAWKKLRECGPVYDGYNGYFRALEPGQVECFNYDALEGALPGRRINALLPEAWSLWLCLQSAEACSERCYANVKNQAHLAEQAAGVRAKTSQAWDEAERQLLAEGLLPVRVLATPSNAGGARYEFEVLVGHEYLPALRETLAWWGAYIIAHRPDVNHLGQVLPASYYTLSVQSVDDQWAIGKMMVLQYYADRAEQKGGAGE